MIYLLTQIFKISIIVDDYGNTQAMIQARDGQIPDQQYYHDPSLQNKDGETVAMLFAKKGIIPPKDWEHDPNIQDKRGNTVYSIPEQWFAKPEIRYEINFTLALMYAKNGLVPPKKCVHDPTLKDDNDYTVALYLAKHGKIPPTEWHHNKFIRALHFSKNYVYRYYYTVQNFLQEQNIEVPEEWKYNNIVDDNENTQAMSLILQGYIPHKKYYHDPSQTNINNDTVALLLAKEGIISPEYWQHNKFIKNCSNQTVAELLSKNKKIPSQYWMITKDENKEIFYNIKCNLQQHNLPVPQHVKNEEMNIFDQAIYKQIPDITGHKPDEQDEDGFTVAMILAYNNINIPQCWYHKPELQNNYGITVAMYMAKKRKIPSKQWIHSSQLMDQNNNTVAILLSQNKILPPIEWEHDKFIQNKNKYTVAQLLTIQKITPTKQWMIFENENENKYCKIRNVSRKNNTPIPKHIKDDELTIFDQACYGIIPDIEGHKSDEQDEDGWTVAMILASLKQEIPQYWWHDPNIHNKNNFTVALIYASKRITPQKQWHHNKFIRGVDRSRIIYNFYTVQNFLEQYKIPIPEEWKYDNVVNYYDDTEAMLQAFNNQIPEQQYYHDPIQINMNKQTVAMILANNGIIPPKEWEHDKFMKDVEKYTVAELLSQQGIVPTKQWMITEDEDEKIFNKILKNLKFNDYEYESGRFIYPKPETEILNDICQICFNEGQQEFVKSKCNHKICLQCFCQLKRTSDHRSCPICRQYNWFEQNQDEYLPIQ